MNLFKKLIPLLAVAASFGSHAAYISVDEWHETTDAYGGLKKSEVLPDVYYAVGQSNTLMFDDIYEILDGYRVASHEEIVEIYYSSAGNRNGTPYYGKGGWDRYVWNGVSRRIFLLSDSAENSVTFHAGGGETTGNAGWITPHLNSNSLSQWAGFVLIKDDAATNGLYSYSKGYFNANDVPTPVGLILLSIGGLLLARKKTT